MNASCWGSSPLTRGKLGVSCGCFEDDGLIPAHAGKTDSMSSRLADNMAHPRSRGENRRSKRHHAGARGSSPLTRGKLRLELVKVGNRGLIPAHAGKTGLWSPPPPGWGSSPLTRGKLVTCRGSRRCQGLIPAHAGKTPPSDHGVMWSGAHPRSRGENRKTALAWARRGGSSPLTRGKLGVAHPSKPRKRLIPAHAGKTISHSMPRSLRWAHPRSRGENAGHDAAAAHGGRLIPAHAGKTPVSMRRGSTGRAHPRSRGENP